MPVIRSVLSLAIFKLFAAASAAHAKSVSEYEQTVDLVSPARCDLVQDRLKHCRIPEMTIEAPVPASTLVPFRSMARVVVTGNCSTTYRLVISLKPDAEMAVESPILRNQDIRLASRNRRALTKVLITDVSPWTSLAGFDSSCRSQLELRLNEPDWNTSEEAKEFLESLRMKLERVRDEHATISSLLSASSTMLALKTVAEQLDRRLSEQDAARIFQDPSSVAALLDRLRESRTTGLSREELLALDRLAEWLDASSSQRSSVGKSFSELFGAEERRVIDKLVSSLGDVEGSRAKLERFSAEIHALESELSIAAQLAEQAFPQESSP